MNKKGKAIQAIYDYLNWPGNDGNGKLDMSNDGNDQDHYFIIHGELKNNGDFILDILTGTYSTEEEEETTWIYQDLTEAAKKIKATMEEIYRKNEEI